MGMPPLVHFLDFISLLVYVSPPCASLPCHASFLTEGAPEEADSVVAESGSAHPADTRSQARRDPPQASAGQGGDEAEREEEIAEAELAEEAAEAELAVGSCEHTPPDSPRAPPQRSLAEVVAGLPGSPVHMLHNNNNNYNYPASLASTRPGQGVVGHQPAFRDFHPAGHHPPTAKTPGDLGSSIRGNPNWGEKNGG